MLFLNRNQTPYDKAVVNADQQDTVKISVPKKWAWFYGSNINHGQKLGILTQLTGWNKPDGIILRLSKTYCSQTWERNIQTNKTLRLKLKLL